MQHRTVKDIVNQFEYDNAALGVNEILQKIKEYKLELARTQDQIQRDIIQRELSKAYFKIEMIYYNNRPFEMKDAKLSLAYSQTGLNAETQIINKEKKDKTNIETGYFNLAMSHEAIGDKLKTIAPEAAVAHYNFAFEILEKISVEQQDEDYLKERDGILHKIARICTHLDEFYMDRVSKGGSIGELKLSVEYAKMALDAELKHNDNSQQRNLEAACFNFATSCGAYADRIKNILPEEACRHYDIAIKIMNNILAEHNNDDECEKYRQECVNKLAQAEAIVLGKMLAEASESEDMDDELVEETTESKKLGLEQSIEMATANMYLLEMLPKKFLEKFGLSFSEEEIRQQDMQIRAQQQQLRDSIDIFKAQLGELALQAPSFEDLMSELGNAIEHTNKYLSLVKKSRLPLELQTAETEKMLSQMCRDQEVLSEALRQRTMQQQVEVIVTFEQVEPVLQASNVINLLQTDATVSQIASDSPAPAAIPVSDSAENTAHRYNTRSKRPASAMFSQTASSADSSTVEQNHAQEHKRRR